MKVYSKHRNVGFLALSGRCTVTSLTTAHSQELTFIGRIEKGFDFLGYHFGPDGLSVAKKTVENFVERAIRLYEQEPGEAEASSRFGLYVRQWVRWTGAGLPEVRNALTTLCAVRAA